METVPPFMVRQVYLLPTTMGRLWYMAGAASYGVVHPCGWQYYMLFVYVWLWFGMRELGAMTLGLS